MSSEELHDDDDDDNEDDDDDDDDEDERFVLEVAPASKVSTMVVQGDD